MASSRFYGDATSRNEVEDVTGSNEHSANTKISPPVANSSVEERFRTLDIFKRPLCLVYTDDKMNLKINDEALQQISRIDVPISVVGVCGDYRTGKSYLMNILAQKRTGFDLGHTVRSHTKGIWAWCIPHPKVSDQVLVLLDTEGFDDAVKGNEEHDLKLFCLTMLMSSTLIYNMKGVIAQETLKKLSFISDVTKQVTVAGVKNSTEEDDKSTLQIISPHFVLCLRDFYYDLVDTGKMTSDAYMESCLSDSSDKSTEEFKNIRRSIRNFFPNRKCFVLAQPALNDDLKCLETLDKGSIPKRFWVDVEKLQTFVYNSDPKYLNCVARNCWDGNTFRDFLRAYIQDLSSGRKLEYGSALDGAGRHHNEKLVNTVSCKYRKHLYTMELPQQSKLQLVTIAIQCMHESLAEFRRDAYPYKKDKYEHKAEETMRQIMNDLVNENSRRVIGLCFDYLQKKYKEMMENSRGMYRTEGGNRKYEQDFKTLLQGYHKVSVKYDSEERCQALETFNDSIKLEVTEMKYDVKLQEETNKYDELRKSQYAEMQVFMKHQKKTLEEIQERDRKETKNWYQEQLKKNQEENEKKLQIEIKMREEQQVRRLELQESKLQRDYTLREQSRDRDQERKMDDREKKLKNDFKKALQEERDKLEQESTDRIEQLRKDFAKKSNCLTS